MTWYESVLEPVLSIQGADRRFISALENVKRAVDGVARSLAGTRHTSNDPGVQTRGDGLRRMQVFIRSLARFAPTMGIESTTQCLDGTGCQTDPCGDLCRLVRTRARVRALRRACGALAPLIRVQFLPPHGRSTTPPEPAGASCKLALDALSIVDAETQLAAVVKHLDATLTAL